MTYADDFKKGFAAHPSTPEACPLGVDTLRGQAWLDGLLEAREIASDGLSDMVETRLAYAVYFEPAQAYLAVCRSPGLADHIAAHFPGTRVLHINVNPNFLLADINEPHEWQADEFEPDFTAPPHPIYWMKT